jgi:uncharacterized RDD family membrane protein YckC
MTGPPDAGDRPAVTAPPDTQDRPAVTPPPDTQDRPAVTAPPDTQDRPAVTAPPDVQDRPATTRPPNGRDRLAITAPRDGGDRSADPRDRPADFRDRPAGRPAARRISTVPPAAQPLQGEPAGLVSRVLAGTVDFCVVVVAIAAGYLGVAALRFLWNSRTFTFPTASVGVLVAVYSVLLGLYLAGSWAVTGRTYGDHLLGLRVVTRRGRRLPPGRAVARAVLCVVFPVGLFWVAASRRNLSVQDLLVGSSVVYDWAPAPPAP